MIINIYIFLSPVITLLSILFISFNPYFVEQLVSQVLFLIGYPNLVDQANDFISKQLLGLPTGVDFIAYAFVVFSFSFCIYTYVNKKVHGVFLLLLALLIYPISNLYLDIVWIRRFVFLALTVPALPRLWYDLSHGINRIAENGRFKTILKSLLLISLLIFVVPGFYAPPFFDGIAGWYLKKEDLSSYTLRYMRIRFNDNSVALFRPSFFNPLTQHYRAVSIIERRAPEFFESSKMTSFLLSLYSEAYPQLFINRLPTQKHLGLLAYSPHTLDRFDIRENYLPPYQVTSFEWVSVIVDNSVRTENILKKWIV